MHTMDREEDSAFYMECYQAEDLSAKMARKFKTIPPPLNLSAMADSDTSRSPLKDFAMLATSPRSPLVQKNLPFRKRAHSYSSTQTSSECDSPDSPRVPASPVAAAPSPSPFTKSPLASPNHPLGKRFLQEPIKSLLPSPNTSASFFNNECDQVKSPSLAFFHRPCPDLLPLPAIEKNSLKSPLQTPTRSVFLQNHVDNVLFFTDIEKFPIKSPLNTPTLRSYSYANNDVFVMPEPISIKSEQIEVEMDADMKMEPLDALDLVAQPLGGFSLPTPPPSSLPHEVKREPSSPGSDRSQDYSINNYLDSKFIDNFSQKMNKNYYVTHNFGLYCSETGMPPPQMYPDHPPPRGKPASFHKPQTYRKNPTVKRAPEKAPDDEVPKKTKKELDEERPRRPMNAFMLFAKHQRPLLIQQHPGKDNRAISVVLGTAWRELKQSEREEYVRRAAAMAQEHKKRHPDCWKRRRVRVNNAVPPTNPAPNLITQS